MFNLPANTQVNKLVPKKNFASFLNSKQKRLFSDFISRIKLLNTLSSSSINLSGDEVKEIHIFEIQLKKKDYPVILFDLFDKFIPYHIILIASYNKELLVSAAQKHTHPANENLSIIDWRFNSIWFKENNFKYVLNLRSSLDFVFSDLCFQLSGKSTISKMSILELVNKERKIDVLQKNIHKLKISIKNCKQYNIKVELNMQLQNSIEELNSLMNSNI